MGTSKTETRNKAVRKKTEDFTVLKKTDEGWIVALKEPSVRPLLDSKGVSGASLRLERERTIVRFALEVTGFPHDFRAYAEALWRGTSLVQWHGSGLHRGGPFCIPGWDVPCYTVKLFHNIQKAEAPIHSYDELKACIGDNNQKALERIAQSNCFSTWRMEALRHLRDQKTLHRIATTDCDDLVRYIAAERLDDKSILKRINKQVRTWAADDLRQALKELTVDENCLAEAKKFRPTVGSVEDIIALTVPAGFSGKSFYQSGACRPIRFDTNPSKEGMEILLRTHKPWTNVINRVVLHIRRASSTQYMYWQTDVFCGDARQYDLPESDQTVF
jgi:uncharacterized protein YfaT (DUF1175 family)